LPEVATTFYEVAIQRTAQMMTDWLYRQGEHGKVELEDTQTAVELQARLDRQPDKMRVRRQTVEHPLAR
jgi:hypothetical protein